MRDLLRAVTAPVRRLWDQPYLLLVLAALWWAGAIIFGRYVVSQLPPVPLNTVRWLGAFFILLPFAWPHLRQDAPAIRSRIWLLVGLAMTGVVFNNVTNYLGLQYTEAINASLLLSTGPLFVAFWALILLGVRLTARQCAGIAISLCGVAVIATRGDVAHLSAFRFNKGDGWILLSQALFGLYGVMASRRPTIHPLSLMATIAGIGSIVLVPWSAWDIASGREVVINTMTVVAALYTAIFPSIMSYAFFNRGAQLIGPNRAVPFVHLTPVFSSVLAIAFLGEQLFTFHLVGFVLVMAGVVLATRSGRAAPAPQ